MTHRAAVMAFLDRFCAADIDGLQPLFHHNLRVEGPFVQCESRAAYLGILRADPPKRSRYRVRRITDEGDTVSVLYDYLKPSGTVLVEQRFHFTGDRIAAIRLEFDPAGFR